MIINHNMQAINTHRQLGVVNTSQSKSMEKLSSGKRINRAGDDAAGLSISEKMRAQIKGLNQASRNAQDGISFIQTAEGALDEVSNMLSRMKELGVQKANGIYNDDDKTNIDEELTNLASEIDTIMSDTEFNGINVFTTTATNIATGHNGEQIVTISAADLTSVSASALAATAIGTGTAPVAVVESAINAINTQRAVYGALQNRLESKIRNTDTYAENLQAAESRIRDTDMAKEMMEYTKNNILLQASQAMLAQANQTPQSVLTLLR